MQLFSKFRWAMTCTVVALMISYTTAALLNTTTYAWPIVERMPPSLVDCVSRVLLFVFWPLLPSGVHEQEEMLELLLVWVFSGLALIPLFVFLVVVRYDLRRSHALVNFPSARHE